MPRVVAIVVTFHSAARIERCLAALAAQRGVEVDTVVVDNASGDDTLARVRRVAGVRVVEAGGNLGYGRANNLVLLGEPAPWFAIVNPDVVCPPDTLACGLEVLRSEPRVGLVGFRQAAPDGTPQPAALAFPDLGTVLAETLGLFRRADAPGAPPGFDPARAQDVDWLAGSCLVVRGEAARASGGFDPAIFMYGEDVDWCMRLARLGWRRRYLPAPVVEHAGGASADPGAGSGSAALYVEHLKGRLLFFERYRGGFATLLLRALTALAVGGRLALHALLPPTATRAASRARLLAGWRWIRSGMPTGTASPEIRRRARARRGRARGRSSSRS
jgi:GT2 family glycosyltransferase